MLEVASLIIEAFPAVRFLLPTTAATHPVVTHQLMQTRTDGERFEVRKDAFDQMVPRCDLAITVSGTATLHVALHRTPMIVVYHGSPLTWNLLGRWLINTRTYALVNLLAADAQLAASGRVTSDMHVVPEFIPWYGPTRPVADYAIDLLRHPEKLTAQRERLANLAARLDAPGASERVAEMALAMLDAKTPNPPMDANGRG
jgi:lipid-A-disaccharide synthase